MEPLSEYDRLIYNEMMSHAPLFSHPNPQKVAIIHNDDGIKQQVLQHPSVTEALQVSDLDKLADNSLDVLIIGHEPAFASFQRYFAILQPNGILLQQSVSPFELLEVKKIQDQLLKSGFSDTQPLLFPQPGFSSGWRSAMLAVKQGMFKRIREKDIYNKSFATRYYNFDMHKAALALPEFMRAELFT